MPNLPTHMNMTQQAAARLDHPIINSHMGSLLLGSTSPDIRIMTKWGRDRTHFAPLTIQRIGIGVEGMFLEHPSLADSSNLSDPTKVFLCGYMNHLVADEAWILEMYHPHLANSHGPSNHILANIWDRALQLEMDRRAHEELNGMAQIRVWLEEAEKGVEVGFIDAETLGQWQSWLSEFTTWDFSWERLRNLTRRMYRDDAQAADMAELFLSGMPESLEEVYRKIPWQRVQDYQEIAVQESVRLMEEYLSVP